MNFNLKNKIVIISGGAKGIGSGIARIFYEEGAVPIILDMDKYAGNKIINDMNRGEFFNIDLCKENDCKKTINFIAEKYNCIDILINNAGINDCIGIDASDQQFIESLRKNLVHYFTLTKFCWPYLQRSKGAIVNIASKVAIVGQGKTSGYAAAKGGILALTKEWAIEGLPHGIRVNAVLPAEVYTEMYEYWLNARYSNPTDIKKQIEDGIPLGKRMTTIDEIAKTVLYLASNMSSHTTGSFLYPDGGYVHLRS